MARRARGPAALVSLLGLALVSLLGLVACGEGEPDTASELGRYILAVSELLERSPDCVGHRRGRVGRVERIAAARAAGLAMALLV